MKLTKAFHCTLMLGVMVFSVFPVQAASLTGDGYGKTTIIAQKEAMADLARKVQVQVQEATDICQKSGGTKSDDCGFVKRYVRTRTELPLMGVDFTDIDERDGLKGIRARLEPERSLLLYRDEIKRRLKNIKSADKQAGKEKDGELKYRKLKNLEKEINEYNKHRLVMIVLGDRKVKNSPVTQAYVASRLLSVEADYLTALMRKEAENLLIESNKQKNSDAKKQKVIAALNKLKSIIADYPFGQGTSFAAESAAFKVAEIERSRNNNCAALVQYQIVRDRSDSDDWIQKANDWLGQLECDDKNKENLVWRTALEGKRIALLCAYEINGEYEVWDKVCDTLNDFILGHGALSAKSALKISAKQTVKSAMDVDELKGIARGNEYLLVFVAKGKVKSRANKKNPMGEDYQFSGNIYNYLINRGQVEFKDKYKGVGGWNPMSDSMAMEVLGLNVAKRWKARYKKNIGNM